MNFKSLSELFPDAMKEVLDPPRGVPLPWYPKLSELIGGLRPHELTLLCAPTGAGKTQFLAGLSAQLCAMDIPHFVAPVETGDLDFVRRVTSQLVREDLNQGERMPVESLQAKTAPVMPLIKKAPLYVADYQDRVDIGEMLTMLKFQVNANRIQVALLDNLNFFLKVTSSTMEKAEMDSAIHEFVILVKKLPIHVILIVHPKKTDGGRVESEFDIKGSSTAVQEAAQVLLMNRPKREDIEQGVRSWTDREFVFRKIRKRGQNVGKSVWMTYQDGRLLEESGHAPVRSTQKYR